jgi:hypothetical protein
MSRQAQGVISTPMYGKVTRPSWSVRAPRGQTLSVEFDPFRRLWRIEPGGYTRRALPDALAQATGSRSDAAWIIELDERLRAELDDRARLAS